MSTSELVTQTIVALAPIETPLSTIVLIYSPLLSIANGLLTFVNTQDGPENIIF